MVSLLFFTSGSTSISSIYSSAPYTIDSFTLRIPVNYRDVALTCLAQNTARATSPRWYRRTEFGLQESSSSSLQVTKNSIMALLTFINGFQPSDVGEYVCSEDNNFTTAAFTIEVGEELSADQEPPCTESNNIFQIQLLDTGCDRWSEREKLVNKVWFLDSLVNILSSLCVSCSSVAAENIMLTEKDTCSAGALTFRGTLINLDRNGVAFCALTSWYRSGSAVVINNHLYLVNRECKIAIDSLDATVCGESAASSMTLIIICGAAAGSGLFLVMFIFSMILCFSCYRR